MNITAVLRPSQSRELQGTLYIHITVMRVSRQFSTHHKLFLHEWDSGNHEVVYTGNAMRDSELSIISDSLAWQMERMRNVVNESQDMPLDSLFNKLRNIRKPTTFFAFMRMEVNRLRLMERMGTAGNYLSTMNSFMAFRRHQDLIVPSLSKHIVEEYGAWLRNQSLAHNTIAFYLRTLRTMYNKAMEDMNAESRNPFQGMRMGIEKTAKRAVGIDVIKKIACLDLKDMRHLDFARDMFLFSVYMRGMPFVDMAYLRKKDLCNGFISYRRRKTNQMLRVEWEQPMQDIVDKYAYLTKGTPYLLPVILHDDDSHRRQYLTTLHRIDRNLMTIGGMIGLKAPLTTYVARHSWASIAHKMNIPIGIISEGLGHDSVKTTLVYLASLDATMIDKANHRIISMLRR